MNGQFDRFFSELPTRPIHHAKVLVTGASGCVGGLLIPVLLKRGYHVRIMVRSRSEAFREKWPQAEVVVADVLAYPDLLNALKGIDYAYYLIHSLPLGTRVFPEVDSRAAINFRRAADANNLKRVIYLGSLGDPADKLSTHLRSRHDVGHQLQQGKTPTTVLRSAVIIGSQSTSYRIIKFLVRNCPILLVPKWSNTLCQPISLRSVILYLVGCLEHSATTAGTFDIGGKSVLPFKSMLQIQAASLGKKRLFISWSISWVDLYAGLACLLTPVRFKVIKALMESCENEVICQNQQIQSLLPFELLTYEEALTYAFSYQRDSRSRRTPRRMSSVPQGPPQRNKWILSDVHSFLLHKPPVSTIIKFNSEVERANYSYRILQRLGVGVEKFKILNIHRIGIHAPAKYVFEELLQWDADSTCWPNNIAMITKRGNRLEHLYIYLFGWVHTPFWLKPLLGERFRPLFKLDAINIQSMPDEMNSDNERYLLYKSSGGYPIGIFSMYVRSSIEDQGEKEQAQLFLMVGFNFYGKATRSKWNPIHKLWEVIHDRVTGNVLNRIKQLSEWRFDKIQSGRVRSDNKHKVGERITS